MDIIKLIPNDLILIIKDYVFGKCSKCNKKYEFWELNRNCIIYQYFSIFEEDYNMQKNPKRYKFICNKCKKLYYEVKQNNKKELILYKDILY